MAEIEKKHLNFAMKNANVVTAFNIVRTALFFRIRGQHRHPRTQRMLRYYFAAQDIHERTNSTHFDYQQITEKLKKYRFDFPYSTFVRTTSTIL